MKLLAIFLLMAVARHSIYADNLQSDITSNQTDSIFGNKVRDALEKIRIIMKTGDESIGFPKLDPYNSDYKDININKELINLNGKFNNCHIEGLSNFTINNADYELTKSNVVIDLTWPNVKGNTLYDIQAMLIAKYPIFGVGNLSVELQNFNFASKIKVKIDFVKGRISMLGLNDTHISLQKLNLNITGLYNNEEMSKVLSSVISDMAPQVLIDFQEEITNRINMTVVPLANKFLENVDIWKYVDNKQHE
ncbi:uncharacterized protein LOC131673500 [Phymastichus coffea]|uniref:uncharacterized protein LOC131673500 n=1 Tax=Phymastichus coffea TaxID=108790 RepID=UPI00273C3719|nr:uncharacterized protein LOC131673500 [Phymastichus coffea]